VNIETLGKNLKDLISFLNYQNETSTLKIQQKIQWLIKKIILTLCKIENVTASMGAAPEGQAAKWKDYRNIHVVKLWRSGNSIFQSYWIEEHVLHLNIPSRENFTAFFMGSNDNI
jgi:hypothetical protein